MLKNTICFIFYQIPVVVRIREFQHNCCPKFCMNPSKLWNRKIWIKTVTNYKSIPHIQLPILLFPAE